MAATALPSTRLAASASLPSLEGGLQASSASLASTDGGLPAGREAPKRDAEEQRAGTVALLSLIHI